MTSPVDEAPKKAPEIKEKPERKQKNNDSVAFPVQNPPYNSTKQNTQTHSSSDI